MTEVTYREALQRALRDSMHADDSITILGEEVGAYGGAYGVTKGLIEEFGAERVIDTPISEAAIVGAAIGCAMTGLRPVAELMYVDFLGLTMDQIANQAAKTRYMFGGQIGVPMVLRTQGGTGRSAGAQHSQSLEAWILHTPGLRLAMPATVGDAYHLLRASLIQPDPVIFIEHKALYARKENADLSAHEPPWGKASIRHRGDRVTVITYSRMVHVAIEAATRLGSEGISVEVIDLRTLNPLDMDTVIDSVNRTGRAIALSEGCLTAGVTAEIAARVTEECFDFLEDPVIRIAGEDIPIPVSPILESASIPTVNQVMNVIKRMLN